MEWLKGYKTYIVAVLAGIAQIALLLGWISQELYLTIMGILVPTGVITMRAGIKNG